MNIGPKALQFLTTLAPTLATALGGPLAGIATTAILGVFGIKTGDSKSDVKALEAAVSGATPEQIAALQNAEFNFQAKMKELGIQEEQLQYADTASARTREEVVKDWTPAVLAYGVTIGFFGVLAYVIHFGIKIGQGQGGEAVLILLGSLGTAWTSMVGYYFGSSVGARRGADALAQIAKQP